MFRRPRQHNDRHLDFIRGLPCVVPRCHDNTSTEAAHIRMGYPPAGKRPTGMGEKPDDKWTVPLCGKHHRDQHAVGEKVFWSSREFNPFIVAAYLWAATGDHDLGEQIVRANAE